MKPGANCIVFYEELEFGVGFVGKPIKGPKKYQKIVKFYKICIGCCLIISVNSIGLKAGSFKGLLCVRFPEPLAA